MRTPLTTRGTQPVKRYAAQANVRAKMNYHLWHHTCATHLVQNGANLRDVQEILGHHNLTTTERYLHLTVQDLQEALRQHHPREKDVARQQARVQNGRHAVNNGTSTGPPPRPTICLSYVPPDITKSSSGHAERRPAATVYLAPSTRMGRRS